jgi:hypothetical protein
MVIRYLWCPESGMTELAEAGKIAEGTVMPSHKSVSSYNEDELFHELMYYTLPHPDPAFIHQNVVDAYAAQTAGDETRNITIVFALIGLYLHVEKTFTGRQVQKAHMQLAKGSRKQWFRPQLPNQRGSIVITDVLAASPGAQRDAMIHHWCVSVWEACQGTRPQIAELAKNELQIG